MANIRMQNIRKSYDGRSDVVHDLNLTIHDGELTVLVGPSGCGKSTTLRMLAGLEEVTSGEIYIGDRLVNNVPPGDRDIAMVFQNYALYPHMTVRQNLAFGLKMRRMPKTEIASRVGQASEALELSALLDRRPRQLSGGQRQRVALGRAIVRDPQVFLFDEPLSNLDAKLRVQMRTEIAALHHRLGTTMVYVTHDQVEAMTLGERIVVMKDGIVQQVDAPLELYNRPANLFVAGFIGSPAMNFIPGQIRAGRFLHDAGELPVGDRLPDVDAVLGVRPEDLSISGEGTPLARVRLEVVEHLGHESMIYFTLAGERQVARLEASTAFRIGDELDLAIKPDQWHLFANDNRGQRLA